MNVLMLLKPKSEVDYLVDTYTLRQGIEKLRKHNFTAIPVLTKEGLYAGSVGEGDFLRFIVDNSDFADSMRKCETISIREILRPDRNPSVTVNVQMRTLIERAENQNFIPVTDDRGYFIGIVTRSTIIKTFCEHIEDDEDIVQPAVPYRPKAGVSVPS